MSVNGHQLTTEEKILISNNVDELIYYETGIGGDVNISSAFIYSLRYPSKYFWILSTNDALSEVALKNLDTALESNTDLVVIDEGGQVALKEITSIFQADCQSLQFGLISAVVYSWESMHSFFSVAPKLNWTGWGQLAAIESKIMASKKIVVRTLSKEMLFSTESNLFVKSRERVQMDYMHSFFGMPLLINSLYYSMENQKKTLIDSWIKTSWYKIYFYSFRKNKKIFAKGDVDPGWIEELAKSILRSNSVRSRTLSYLGSRFNFDLLKDKGWAIKIRKKIEN